MKTRKILLATGLLLSLLIVSLALAQTPSQVERSVVGGGGEKVSVSGSYALNGTIGEPLAGDHVQSGSHQLTAGFWAGVKPGAKAEAKEKLYVPLLLKSN